MNVKINEKSKDQHEILNYYIQAIMKDARATASTQEEMFRSFAKYIVASTNEN